MTEAKSRVTLLHTNDIHSHLEQAAQIAGYIRETRGSVDKADLLVVDCGDFLDRARAETEGTEGKVNRDLLRSIGYDALTLGNNEGLTYSYGQIDAFYSGLSIPVVCANFRPLNPDRLVPWLVRSLIVRKAGLNVGLIGLTAPFNDYYQLLGWHAADPMEAAAEEVARLRNQVDVIVVLSHLGLRQDERLAANVQGIDVILGGHTHHLLEKPLFVGSTALCAAGKFGRYIGRLELSLNSNGGIRIEGGCLPTEAFTSDEEAQAIIETGKQEAKRRMNRIVGDLAQPLRWANDRESPLAVLLAAVVRRKTGAAIGLVNAGQFLGELPAGQITEEMVHSLCPSPINCCRMRLTGRELLHVMEESQLPEFQELEIRGFGFRGEKLGILCYDGLEAEVDPGRPPYSRILSVTVNGEPLDPYQEYEVGTLDMFTFGVGHAGLKAGRDIRYDLPDFIRELLCDALNDKALIADAGRARIHLTGEQPS